MIAEEVMLAFPENGDLFEIWTDSSDIAISGGIRQNNKWLGFFSKKLTETQTKYPITDRELLAIVEVLKAFRHMLLGQKITVYTDHQNLTYANTKHSSDRVLRQRLVLEEYGVNITYIKGAKNKLADALSRLPFESELNAENTEELYMNRRVSEMEEDFPLSLNLIAREQAHDDHLQTELGYKNPKYTKDTRENIELYVTTTERKIYVPVSLRDDLIKWYHEMLLHPGEARMKATVKQHFYWKGIDAAIESFVSTCDACQKNKITAPKKYGKIPMPNNIIVEPWDSVHVDMIGPWTVSFKITNTSRTIQKEMKALTIIDQATGWVEFVPTTNFLSAHVSYLFDTEWLCRYPRPKQCGFDNGGEFVGAEFQELLASYGIEPKPTTVKNPRGNAICERVHLTMGDMLRTMTFEGEDWLEEMNRTLQSVAWAIRTTVSTTTGQSPGQLVFSRDMILATKIKIDWMKLKAMKQQSALQNNIKENKTRIDHEYQVGDKVLIVLDTQERKNRAKLNTPTKGPYTIIKIFNNGTVTIRREAYDEIINIRRLKPYKEN